MQKNKLVSLLLLAALLLPVTGHAQNRRGGEGRGGEARGGQNAPAEGRAISVRAIAISVSKERGPTDRQVAPYESILRRFFPNESFRYAGEGSTTVPAGGKASLTVQGHRIDLQSEGGTVFARTGDGGASLTPGGPGAVLVFGSGSAIIVVAR